MDSDRASSSSPEPMVSKKSQKKSKEKSKTKGSGQPSVVITPHGKNEGTNTDWAYKVPDGATLSQFEVDEDFDWDSLKDDEDLELWIVRVPEGVKAKHLQNLKLDAPSHTNTSRIGSLERKHASYDVWTLGAGAHDAISAEEVRGLSCLLPRTRKGSSLYHAPPLPTRHIVVQARPAVPQPVPSDASHVDRSWLTHQNPPRPSYPKEMLTHRFMPAGSLVPEPTSTTTASANDVDMDISHPPEDIPSVSAEKHDGEKKPKKRKGEGEAHGKKSKKSKTSV